MVVGRDQKMKKNLNGWSVRAEASARRRKNLAHDTIVNHEEERDPDYEIRYVAMYDTILRGIVRCHTYLKERGIRSC